METRFYDDDIITCIQTYDYSKAKKILSVFLKNVFLTLQTQHEDLTGKINNVCITSVIFHLLSSKQLTTYHNIENENNKQISQYKDSYKDLLRFLSWNVFNVLHCNELIFYDDAELESFIQSDREIVDILISCEIDKKMKLLQTIYSRLKVIGGLDKLSPLDVISLIEDLLFKTNSFQLSEFKSGIENLVEIFGGKDFDWENLNSQRTENMETEIIRHDKYITTDVDVMPFSKATQTIMPLTFSKAIQTDDLIINNGKILFADTVANILKLDNIEFETLSFNQINSIINSFVREKLKDFVSPRSEVDVTEFRQMYSNYNKLNEILSAVLKELEISDLNVVVSKIKQMNNFLKSLFNLFNVNNEYGLYGVIEHQNTLVKSLDTNFTDFNRTKQNIAKLLFLNNNSTLNKFVKDFKALHEIFLECNFNVLFSVENVGLLLRKLKESSDQIEQLKKQYSEKTAAFNSLKCNFTPILDLQNKIDLPPQDIADFINNIFKEKPPNVSNKQFLGFCETRIYNFEATKKECTKLKSENMLLTSEISKLEKEYTDYLTIKDNLTKCHQKLLEKDRVIYDLEEQNRLAKEEFSQLEAEHNEYRNALIIAEQYNRERNQYIEELENSITEK
jgi:hypothetical protein